MNLAVQALPESISISNIHISVMYRSAIPSWGVGASYTTGAPLQVGNTHYSWQRSGENLNPCRGPWLRAECGGALLAEIDDSLYPLGHSRAAGVVQRGGLIEGTHSDGICEVKLTCRKLWCSRSWPPINKGRGNQGTYRHSVGRVHPTIQLSHERRNNYSSRRIRRHHMRVLPPVLPGGATYSMMCIT